MSTITALPRTIIKAGLQGLRLPLTAVERVTNHADASAWPPAVAYEAFEAEAKMVIGSLIRDDELVREGRLQRAKVNELAEAERLQTEAEQKRQAADAAFEAREESLDEARARAEEQARRREQQVAEERAAKERAVREETERRKDAAARSAAAVNKAVTAQEREARRTRVAEESAAVAKRSQALNAEKRVQTLDAALEAKKNQRKTG